METTQIVLPSYLTKMISGRIMWDKVRFHDLVAYNTDSTRTLLARIFNFDVCVRKAIKNPPPLPNVPDFLGPYSPGNIINGAKTTFNFLLGEDGTNFYASFIIEGIPVEFEEVFVKVSVTGNVLPPPPCDQLVFSSNDAVIPYTESPFLLKTTGLVSHIDIHLGCMNIS